MLSYCTSALLRTTASISIRSLSTATKTTKIGIVGCGNVGNAVAHNLHRDGYSVVAAVDTDSSRTSLMPDGVNICKSAREVAELSDVIITGLPRPPNVKDAAVGPDGFLAGLAKDKVWIDHSTTDYEQTLLFNEQAKEQGAHVLEAPITGGLEALKQGQMVVFTGGDRDVAEAMKPILNCSYKEVFYAGEIGHAMLLKVMSNTLCCVNLIGMQEALMLAKRAGLDLRKFWEAIRPSVGTSYAWETAAPTVFNGTYDPGFTIALLCKDIQLGYEMSRKYKVPMDLHGLMNNLFRRANYQFGDDAGCYSTPKALEQELGESLNIPGFEKWAYDNEIINGSIVVKHKNI